MWGEAAYSTGRFFITDNIADPDGVFETGQFGDADRITVGVEIGF